MDWTTWTQQTFGNVINLAANKQYVLDPQLEAAKWKALGDAGYYTEGQPGTTQQANGITPGTMLLLAGVVVVVLMLKD